MLVGKCCPISGALACSLISALSADPSKVPAAEPIIAFRPSDCPYAAFRAAHVGLHLDGHITWGLSWLRSTAEWLEVTEDKNSWYFSH